MYLAYTSKALRIWKFWYNFWNWGGGISPIVPSGYAPACDTRLTIGRLPSGPTSLAHNCSL